MYFLLFVYLDPEKPPTWNDVWPYPAQHKPTSIYMNICIWNKMHIESTHFKKENYTEAKTKLYYVKKVIIA